MASAHLSPRILSAWDQLDQAVRRLQTALEGQSQKVDAAEVQALQKQIDGLKEDNLALTQELETIADEESSHDIQALQAEAAALQTQVSVLHEQADNLLNENQTLKDVNADFAARIDRLIGNVEQILEES